MPLNVRRLTEKMHEKCYSPEHIEATLLTIIDGLLRAIEELKAERDMYIAAINAMGEEVDES